MSIQEAFNHYRDARKKGLASVKRLSSGQKELQKNLVCLEDVKKKEIISEVDIGVLDVPLKNIAGTNTKARSTSFSPDFMPLLPTNTEFASKWISLCNAHLEEGLQHPVKTFEYLNFHYVIEGNKRISVLKYFGAYSYHAKVIRLVPKYDETDIEIRLYYEFMYFCRKTGINNIWFTELSGFKKMYDILEKQAEKSNIAENGKYEFYKLFMKSIYYDFSYSLNSLGGNKLSLTTGDMLLIYESLYGLPELPETFNSEQNIIRIRNLVNEMDAVIKPFFSVDGNDIPLAGTTEKTIVRNIFDFVIPKDKLRISFAYPGILRESKWSKAHEKGRLHIQKVFGDKIETTYEDNIPEGIEASEKLNELAGKSDIIFATSPAFMNAALKTSLEYPGAKILNCSEYQPFKHVSTYFGRLYEARFLIGIIAGSLTKSGIVGYVGNYPARGILSGINAFALGVRMVNPRADIIIKWSRNSFSKESSNDINRSLLNEGADIICHQNTFVTQRYTGDYGLYSVKENYDKGKLPPFEYIATPVWNWGIFYEKIIGYLLSGTIRNISDMVSGGAKPASFWWGLDTGIVDICYAKKHVPLETHKLVSLFRKLIAENSYNIFQGPLFDNKGLERIPPDMSADSHSIITMDWYVNGLKGETGETFFEIDREVSSGILEL